MKVKLTVLALGLLAAGLFRHSVTPQGTGVTTNGKTEPTITASITAAEAPKPQPRPVAQTPQPSPQPISDSREAYISYARTAAVRVGLRPGLLLAQINHESGFRATAVSPTGDYGIAQINLASHPNISLSQAFDPYWATDWMAQSMADKVRLYGEFQALVTYNCGHPYCYVSYNYAQTILNNSYAW